MNAATITLCNLSGVAEGNSVKTTGDYKALVAPQTLTAGTVFMEVTMSDGRSDEYVLPEDVEEVFPDVARHRIVLNTRSRAAHVTELQVIAQILKEVPQPTAQK